jgi:hypothetical protein
MKKILSIIAGLAISATAFSINIVPGWQLIGTEHDINISIFNNKNIKSVWAYDKVNKKWKVYTPNKNINLSKYGIEPLTKLNKYDGFWINASTDFTLNSEINQSNNQIQKDYNYSGIWKGTHYIYLVNNDNVYCKWNLIMNVNPDNKATITAKLISHNGDEGICDSYSQVYGILTNVSNNGFIFKVTSTTSDYIIGPDYFDMKRTNDSLDENIKFIFKGYKADRITILTKVN